MGQIIKDHWMIANQTLRPPISVRLHDLPNCSIKKFGAIQSRKNRKIQGLQDTENPYFPQYKVEVKFDVLNIKWLTKFDLILTIC
jgi:hypothetical protein